MNHAHECLNCLGGLAVPGKASGSLGQVTGLGPQGWDVPPLIMLTSLILKDCSAPPLPPYSSPFRRLLLSGHPKFQRFWDLQGFGPTGFRVLGFRV